MALSPRPLVALLALLALVAPPRVLVASERKRCATTSRSGPFLHLDVDEPGVLSVTNGEHWGYWGHAQFCPPGSFANGIQLKSPPRSFGSWGQPEFCPPGQILVSFRLRVEVSQGLWDDTGATDMAVMCSEGSVLEGGGLASGDWGDWSQSCAMACGICGIRSRVEPNESGDNSGLNDVKLYCCT
ncbi:PREDICTED: vitelline membrane outer layer protein 1 homolog [Ficedula albicollis]|uniref:vitelline membrane outer layer protein 1 homolog n=1 Tax=Ficedula albicollis TaxID=59894 RepID=UPI0007AD88C7|nr:PREDICTED: vitelline membrane outer layer protein 1 homolog [Ficedula albicollis]